MVRVVRFLVTSRRSLLANGLALGMLWRPVITGAKTKRKHKQRKKKARPNAFGCLDVGDPCTSEAHCCSGVCDTGTACLALCDTGFT